MSLGANYIQQSCFINIATKRFRRRIKSSAVDQQNGTFGLVKVHFDCLQWISTTSRDRQIFPRKFIAPADAENTSVLLATARFRNLLPIAELRTKNYTLQKQNIFRRTAATIPAFSWVRQAHIVV